MSRRVAVTGIGMVTPVGVGVDDTWEGVVAGRSAIGPVRRFDASGLPVTFAAEVMDPGPFPGTRGDLKLRLAASATAEALSMAGDMSGPRTGVCMGSEVGRPALDQVADRMFSGKGPDPEAVELMDPACPTRLIAEMAGATGPSSTVSTACTSSSQAIGEGLLRIRTRG